ncbi:hypothetical protein [Lysinibacillus varians]|uniref:Uncharacterized protein n=1 Tax=Lysinibacillus varians TaxID=1145276 RepID=A0ABY2T687_9BACI|nr:hypothetical protein [Lysinibacillus varians]AHN24218.1 hypothetical protein T479_12035 [Lysinibacillus varians]TKI51195.1 hypothetical protein FC752_22350 [Lysinibacillus varians]
MVFSEKELLHELLKHRYGVFYFAHPKNREMALKLHDMGYFNDEIGQVTELGQEYFDNLYLNVKERLLVELKNGKNKTYNQISSSLGFEENTLYLHHFLKKLENEQILYYREGEDFNSNFKIMFR